ncbi:MAG: DUF6636 domain-containing protein [Solirubrobacterales bacterium]
MTRRLLLSMALSLAALALTASAAPAKLKLFQSPSHNIGCVMAAKYVRCDIRHHKWPTPPKPPTCDVDYGQGVAIDTGNHPANYVCAGDTVLDPQANVLAYGNRIANHRFRCASKTTGMRCVNRDTKHGFFLSVDEVRLF